MAYKWYTTNKTLDWFDLKGSFREEFGKSQVEHDLTGESGRMLISKDPKSDVYHVLFYVQATNPRGTKTEKLICLFDVLPSTD